MQVIRRALATIGCFVNSLFKGIEPPPRSRPPDIDGGPHTGDLTYDRAVLEAKMADQIGPGGTLG